MSVRVCICLLSIHVCLHIWISMYVCVYVYIYKSLQEILLLIFFYPYLSLLPFILPVLT